MENSGAIILAAGKGTRMGLEYPKVLAKSDEGELLGVLLKEVISSPIKEIVLVVGFQANEVIDFVKRNFNDPRIKFVIQEEQLGTGHAVKVALKGLGDVSSVFVLLGDVPLVKKESLRLLLEYMRKHDHVACFYSMLVFKNNEYGRVIRDFYSGRVISIEEYRHCTSHQKLIREVSTGVFVFDFQSLNQVMNETGEYLLESCRSRNIEFYLPLILDVFAAKGMLYDAILTENSDEFVGVNKKEELTELNLALNRMRINKFKESGVEFRYPETVYVSPATQISENCVIGPHVYFFGENRIGAGNAIEGFTYLYDVSCGNKNLIKAFCYIEGARFGDSCVIGPFARIREGTKISDEVRIGNFVETKNAELATGVKVNHLSYLGDCSIGAKSNIGAGTITCNFDGFSKHFTKIGSECLIGANVNLIAPIEIGSRVLIGAGSTVTKNLHDGCLFVERADSKLIDGGFEKYCQRKKK